MRILVKRERKRVVLDHMCPIHCHDTWCLVNIEAREKEICIRYLQLSSINNRTSSFHHCYNCLVYIMLCNILLTSIDVWVDVYTCKRVNGGSEKKARAACKYAPT
jgi:hypothetical protein